MKRRNEQRPANRGLAQWGGSASFDSFVVGLSVLKEAAHLQIVNFLGETVATQKATMGNNTIDVSHLTSGVYFLQVGNKGAVKIVKE